MFTEKFTDKSTNATLNTHADLLLFGLILAKEGLLPGRNALVDPTATTNILLIPLDTFLK